MRVGLDGYSLAEPRTGVGHYTFELARALALIAPADEFELVSPAPFDQAVVNELADCNLPNLRLSNPKAKSIRGHWWAVGLPAYARRGRFDLFHGTNFDVPLWGLGRRTVLTIHDLSALLHPDKHRARLVRRSRLRLPLIVRLAGALITPTESVRREVCEHFRIEPEKVTAIHSAPRLSFQPMAPPQTALVRERLGVNEDFILFVGTIEPRKNLLTLVKAYEQILRHTSLRPQLVIAGGEGWLMDELFAFIKQSGIEKHLRLTGYLPDEDLRALYSSCKVFIYPSVYEGFGLPPLEAMACGAPVIVGTATALRETVGEVASIVESPEALAKKITELLEDDAQRAELSRAGKQHAAGFTWERTARQTLEVYRRVLGQPNS